MIPTKHKALGTVGNKIVPKVWPLSSQISSPGGNTGPQVHVDHKVHMAESPCLRKWSHGERGQRMRRSSIIVPHNRSGRDAESKGSSHKRHPAATSSSTQKQVGPATSTDSRRGGLGGCSVFPSPLGSRSAM